MQALLVLQCLGKHGFWNMMLFVALPALADILNLPVPPSAPVSLSPNQGGYQGARKHLRQRGLAQQPSRPGHPER